MFTAGALTTLTLGIGASVAIASATYAILWRPLPVHDEKTLVVGYATNKADGTGMQRDLAIRTALGAQPSSLARGVVTQAAWMVLPGLLAGVALAMFATRSLSLLLLEVKPDDPWAFAGAISAVIAVAPVAAAIPARRAARVNVVAALKS